MAILIMFLILGVIIMIHEYGHFIAARKCGVFVEEFAIGMGPKLFGKIKNGTLYSIRLFPIGGYCRMKDEDSTSTDVDSFGNATKLRKFIILFAGAFMNFLLAIVIFVGISLFSVIRTTEIQSVDQNLPAYSSGIKEGDKIYEINGDRMRIFSDIAFFLSENGDKQVQVTVKRGGEKIKVDLIPAFKNNTFLIGITPKVKSAFFGERIDGFEKATLYDSLYDGFFNMIFAIKTTVIGFMDLFTAQININEVMGPIGLAPVINDTYQEAAKIGIGSVILTMLNLTALLSANIGILNLLPLPALDGGRILFLAIEFIRGKPIPEEKEGMIHFVGLVVLMAFGIFIAFKDLINIF